jgi:hypothetical protein
MTILRSVLRGAFFCLFLLVVCDDNVAQKRRHESVAHCNIIVYFAWKSQTPDWLGNSKNKTDPSSFAPWPRPRRSTCCWCVWRMAWAFCLLLVRIACGVWHGLWHGVGRVVYGMACGMAFCMACGAWRMWHIVRCVACGVRHVAYGMAFGV